MALTIKAIKLINLERVINLQSKNTSGYDLFTEDIINQLLVIALISLKIFNPVILIPKTGKPSEEVQLAFYLLFQNFSKGYS